MRSALLALAFSAVLLVTVAACAYWVARIDLHLDRYQTERPRMGGL
jgi:hypothetical protein